MNFYKYELGQEFRLTIDVVVPVTNSEEAIIGEAVLKKGAIIEIESSGSSSEHKERYYFVDFVDEEFGDVSHCFFESELGEFELVQSSTRLQ